MTVTDENDICSRLETIAGVRVSQDWLTACRAHLRETRLAETADSILHQVLHSDLRDVVSRQDDDGMLRRALQEEFAELPESFRLMVQVEELLDVSLNAEARLSVGPASPTSPTPVGNQHMRCLKLYFSDGYLLLGGIHLVGMEMAPIPDLSVHSKAGLKLILKGPLTCRFGIIMCSPSNTNVLGGSVVSLMEMQQKTLEQAQRLAGVGVDPTVKALIWNPIGAEEEGEALDEGEHESRDVEAAPPPGPRAPPPVVPRAPPPRTRTPPPPSAYNVPSRPHTRTPPPPPSAYNVSAVATRPAPAPISNQGAPSTNPYARCPTPFMTTDAAFIDLAVDEPIAEVLDLITPTNNHTTTPQSASIASSRSQCTQETLVKEADKTPMSFAELRALISRLQSDQELYREYQQAIFVVPCKMKGSHQYFNICKKRHRDKKDKNDKYEYVMEVNMGGTSDSDGTLKCLVANDILQTHFRLRPGEMRMLSREDRAKSQSYVDEGGRKAKATLITFTSWQLKLVPQEEYLAKKDDDAAILQLVRRD